MTAQTVMQLKDIIYQEETERVERICLENKRLRKEMLMKLAKNP